MHRTGDRFSPEGDWKEVGGYVKGGLLADINALATAYLSAKPLPATPLVQVPEGLREPSSDHGRIPFTGVRLVMERLDAKDGLLDVLGEIEAEGDCEGLLAFMLTLEPVSTGGYRLWSSPTLVP